jgi:hypothetical protein
MMNERIRELAKQTGYIWHASGEPQIYEFNPEKLEKFAEMIVRECAGLFPLTFTDEQYQRRIDKTILKHFGVEETKREQIDKAMREAFKNGVDLSGRNTP